jgi:hypothetical protein
MKIKSLFATIASTFLAATILLTVGCGGDANDTDSADVDVAKLEAKALKGDAAAAYKAAEIFSQDSDMNASMIAALKWFRVAQVLGNPDAALAVTTLERTATPAQIEEGLAQALAFKVQK